MDATLSKFVTYMTHHEYDIPILKTTHETFKNLFEKYSFDLEVDQIEENIMLDPYLALKIVLKVSHLKKTNLTSEIDCIKKAILLLGTKNVLSIALSSTVIEDRPENEWIELAVKRAIYASNVAKKFSEVRFDIRPTEIALATILADLGELMMWTFKPQLAIKVTEKMISRECTRNHQAQIAVFGFKYKDLSVELAKSWHLSTPIINILEKKSTDEVRTKLSHLCVDVARHLYGIDGYKEIANDILNLKELIPFKTHKEIIHILNLYNYLTKEQYWHILEELHFSHEEE